MIETPLKMQRGFACIAKGLHVARPSQTAFELDMFTEAERKNSLQERNRDSTLSASLKMDGEIRKSVYGLWRNFAHPHDLNQKEAHHMFSTNGNSNGYVQYINRQIKGKSEPNHKIRA